MGADRSRSPEEEADDDPSGHIGGVVDPHVEARQATASAVAKYTGASRSPSERSVAPQKAAVACPEGKLEESGWRSGRGWSTSSLGRWRRKNDLSSDVDEHRLDPGRDDRPGGRSLVRAVRREGPEGARRPPR